MNLPQKSGGQSPHQISAKVCRTVRTQDDSITSHEHAPLVDVHVARTPSRAPSVQQASSIPPVSGKNNVPFVDFLRSIDPNFPRMAKALAAIGVDTTRSFNAFANLRASDDWLRSLERCGKLTVVERIYLEEIINSYSRTNVLTSPRFIDRFNFGLHQHDANITAYFLTALYPPLPHLHSQLTRLGIVSAEDLRVVVALHDHDKQFYAAVLETGLLTPLEAMIICEAFTVLAMRRV